MIDCEQLAPLYEEYALGILDGEERAEIDAHLARACPRCMPGVAQARFMVAQLALASPEVEPPASLRGKIMEAAKSYHSTASAIPFGKPSAPRTLFPAWAWIAAAALALVTGYTIRQMGNQNAQLAELRKQMRLATMQSQALQNQIEQGRMVASVMMSPDSKPLKLMPTKDKTMPMVHAYLHPHMGVAITADEMPAVSPGRTLQLWFVPKTGTPVSAAIFRPDASGQIALVAPVTVPMDQIAALAVTEEPAGGSPRPTSAIAWMSQVN